MKTQVVNSRLLSVCKSYYVSDEYDCLNIRNNVSKGFNREMYHIARTVESLVVFEDVKGDGYDYIWRFGLGKTYRAENDVCHLTFMVRIDDSDYFIEVFRDNNNDLSIDYTVYSNTTGQKQRSGSYFKYETLLDMIEMVQDKMCYFGTQKDCLNAEKEYLNIEKMFL